MLIRIYCRRTTRSSKFTQFYSFLSIRFSFGTQFRCDGLLFFLSLIGEFSYFPPLRCWENCKIRTPLEMFSSGCTTVYDGFPHTVGLASNRDVTDNIWLLRRPPSPPSPFYNHHMFLLHIGSRPYNHRTGVYIHIATVSSSVRSVAFRIVATRRHTHAHVVRFQHTRTPLAHARARVATQRFLSPDQRRPVPVCLSVGHGFLTRV